MAKIVTTTKAMKRCIEKMMRDASHGREVCRYSVYNDMVTTLQKEGLVFPSFDDEKATFPKKNPIKLVISWGDGNAGTAKVLAKKVKGYRNKNNRKDRDLGRKNSRREKHRRKSEIINEWVDSNMTQASDEHSTFLLNGFDDEAVDFSEIFLKEDFLDD